MWFMHNQKMFSRGHSVLFGIILSIAAYFFSEYSIEMNKDIKRKMKIPRVAEKKHNNS